MKCNTMDNMDGIEVALLVVLIGLLLSVVWNLIKLAGCWLENRRLTKRWAELEAEVIYELVRRWEREHEQSGISISEWAEREGEKLEDE